ncbi:MAG: serine/threonine-protein kinase [Longimicrobiaceae bacterium]
MSETHAAVAAVEAELAPDFRLLRLLGEGAMACVYLARETALERLVAVKVLRPEYAADPAAARRFQREARSAARIAHPNVAAVHRVGTLGGGTPYLVMEHVAGRTLADALAAGGAMEPERARAVLAQLAAALAAAHRHHVIHRDVRPGNVLLENETGRAVLGDFGIAAVMDGGGATPTRLTPLGDVLGDPRYLSPEQLLGERVTEAADVYSLGVVGYELLTLEGPFAAASNSRTVVAHLQAAPRPLRALCPAVDAALAGVLERCLAKKPEHRPRAAELARALAGPPGLALAAEPGDEPLFPALAAFARELKRRRVYRAGAAYAVGLFVLLQGADIVLPVLKVPPWTLTALLGAGLAGFPVVLVFTWIFDVTRTGIHRTEALPDEARTRGSRRARLALQLAALGLSIALAGVLGWLVLR